ncbi:MAG TPA: hypothetical protein VHZ03_54760 [Trebonia sp.]|jgi:hypothetical protein|nr:hypothetical protein [Trebonia sp.]
MKPGGPDACPEVRRARAAAAKARTRAEDLAGPAPDPAAKVNTADPASRVMPLQKGGYDQLHNVQALATAGSQVILAITRHDSPNDVHALTGVLAEARRVLDAAGIAERIRRACSTPGTPATPTSPPPPSPSSTSPSPARPARPAAPRTAATPPGSPAGTT